MANPEHFEILKRGVEEWNQWRKNNPDVRPDLREADLSKREASTLNLSAASFVLISFII